MPTSKLEHVVNILITPVRNQWELVSAGFEPGKRGETSMKTPGMAVFNQQNVEDFYEIGEVLGR